MKIKDLKRKIELERPEIASIVAGDLSYQIGKKVEMARLTNRLTQAELARRIGTRQSSISRIESGASLPSLSFLVKIADALETTIIAPDFASVTSYYQDRFNFRAHFASTVAIHSPFYPIATINSGKVAFS